MEVWAPSQSSFAIPPLSSHLVTKQNAIPYLRLRYLFDGLACGSREAAGAVSIPLACPLSNAYEHTQSCCLYSTLYGASRQFVSASSISTNELLAFGLTTYECVEAALIVLLAVTGLQSSGEQSVGRRHIAKGTSNRFNRVRQQLKIETVDYSL
jgi:hypothetical protein